MENKNNTLYYLKEAPVSKAIFHMAIPMILSMIINIIYNITDAFYIGMLNSTSMLATMALVLPFTTILMAIGEIFGTGGSTYISRLLGEKNWEGVKKASVVNFYLSIFAGFIFILIIIPMTPSILKILGSSGSNLIPTKNFITVYTIGAPFIITNFTLAQTLRGEGASKESLIGMLISIIINILLDPIFIFSFQMGTSGAALGTVIGNIFAVIYYIWYLTKKSTVQSTSFKYFKPDKDILTNIFKVGISAFSLCCFLIISGLVFNNYTMMYGEHVVAAFGIANRICQISDFIGIGLYVGVVPLIAFAYSAGNTERLKKILKTTVSYLTIAILGISFVLYILRNQVMSLFSIQSDLIDVGTKILVILLISTLFAGISGMFTSMFQAFGKGIQSNIMSVTKGIIFIPIIIIGNILFELDGVIWSITISEFLTSLIGLLLWIFSRKSIIDSPLEERISDSLS